MRMESWWNDADRGKSKDSECHFVHHEFRVVWPGIEPESARCKTNAWVMAGGPEVILNVRLVSKLKLCNVYVIDDIVYVAMNGEMISG
jgi:hypothetical protein